MSVLVDQEPPKPQQLTPICAIGASAGGIKALQQLFSLLDDNLGIIYVVIVHLAPDHPSQLADILRASTKMSVLQVKQSLDLKPDCVYVIPPDRELVIEDNRITARPFKEPRGQRAPIDMFFRSIAAARGDGFGVVLSGAGADGAAGVESVKAAGGIILVQDPLEAEVATMPRSAIATGVADFIEPIATLAIRIREVARSKLVLTRIEIKEADREISRILSFLHARTGHDFSSYKDTTIRRRIGRRMQVTRQTTFADYARYMVETPEEAEELFSDFLISVTAFFRDRYAYNYLAHIVVPGLFDAHGADDAIRIWSVGCATGEEAYSLAILILEEAERRETKTKIQIFASDLDEGALATAREGRFPRTIEADVSEDRLERFFVAEVEHYRVRKEVRDLVLFAHHSVLKDAPFIRLDMVACRNLLIYLDRDLQSQLLTLFHYSLLPGGRLFLGSAETAESRPELFAVQDRDARVYRAKARSTASIELFSQLPFEHRHDLAPTPRGSAKRDRTPGAVHSTTLERLAPPSALVDEDHRVINLSPTAGNFISPPEGPLSQELPDIVRPELRAELRSALHRAFSAGQSTYSVPVAVAFNGDGVRRVAVYVTPSVEPNTAPLALVIFMDVGLIKADAEQSELGEEAFGATEIQRLREELRSAQERLSSSRREHESSVQELRIANEELQSVNEEYRSTAEELETSREELQSINEELQTVNAELKARLDNTASAHSDLQNLINATEIGTLFLDAELRIKMLTPAVELLFNVTDSDVGRPITDFTHKLIYDRVEEDAWTVLRTLAPLEGEVETKDHRWLMMRLRPYRTIEDRIEGVVLSFVDITQRRQAEQALGLSEERYRLVVEGSHDDGLVK